MKNPPFSREEMLEELIFSIRILANFVARYGNMEAAEALTGFRTKNAYDAYLQDESMKFKLERYNVTVLMILAYNYAFQVDNPAPFDDELAEDIEAFIEGANKCGNDLTFSPMADPSSKCRIVAEAAFARWKIQDGWSVSTREMALLVGVEQFVVENLLLSENIDFKPHKVKWHEAYYWLQKHPNFIDSLTAESRLLNREEAFFGLFNEKGVSAFESAMRTAGVSPEELARKANVELACIRSLELGKPDLDMESARRIGQALDVDVPSFVAAVEIVNAPQ